MVQPKITRPHFPKGYVDHPKSLLPWSHVVDKLTQAINYWVCSVYPDGRPHVIPKWGVMIGAAIYYDGSPETRHALNIAQNPNISVHLESGTEVVIVDGQVVELKESPLELREEIALAYTDKYFGLGYSPLPSFWENGGLYRVTIRSAIAWTKFTEDPTKFIFEP